MSKVKDLQLTPVLAVEYARLGKTQVAFYYDYVPNSVRVERLIGGLYPVTRIAEVSPIHWLKTLDELLTLWKNGDLEKDASELGETKVSETDAEARLRRLTTLDAIIRGGPARSSEGEVAIAREIFKRYTGKEWAL